MHNVTSFLRCTYCGCVLENGNGEIIKNGFLKCSHCGEKYHIKNYVPQMIPSEISKVLSAIAHTREDEVSPSKSKESLEWFSDLVGVPFNAIKWSHPNNFGAQLAVMREQCDKRDISEFEEKQLPTLIASENMATGYRPEVADPLRGSIHATTYEDYEDAVLDELCEINNKIRTEKIVFIEIGSGVGRKLHLYGSKILNGKNVSARYRRLIPEYRYNQDYAKNLIFILGIDFETEMIRSATNWIDESNLSPLVTEEGRIVQILGMSSHLHMDFGGPAFGDPYKIITILFQTLGNQLDKELQINMLKKAKEFATPNGTVFLSVFNRNVFDQQASEYYKSIEGAVGKMVYCENGTFISDKGVFSRWFYPEEVHSLFKEAGYAKAKVLYGDALKTEPPYKTKEWHTERENYKQRAIFGIAEVP